MISQLSLIDGVPAVSLSVEADQRQRELQARAGRDVEARRRAVPVRQRRRHLDAGATAIAEALKTNRGLHTLVLRENNVGDAGAAALFGWKADEGGLACLRLVL